MKGFTGDIYNGHNVFIRSEYESYYGNLSETERLGDCLGLYFGDADLSAAIDKAINRDLSLVYNVRSYEIDMKLREYESVDQMWQPYRCGYVHKVTGEYVEGAKPTYDSYPCWCKVSSLNKRRVAENVGDAVKMGAFMAGLYALFGGR